MTPKRKDSWWKLGMDLAESHRTGSLVCIRLNGCIWTYEYPLDLMLKVIRRARALRAADGRGRK